LELKSAYPNAAIYLSGSLTVDFPEEVKLPIQPDQYQTVSLSGAAVNLEYLGVESAIRNAIPSGIAVLKE
jgi:inner membrane protein